MLNTCMSNVEAFHENSRPFFKFLRDRGLDDLLKKTRLRLRERHTIVPHVRDKIIHSVTLSHIGFLQCTASIGSVERITDHVTRVP